MIWLALGALVAALALRVPVAYAIIGAAAVYLLGSPIPSEVLVQDMMGTLQSFPLLAIPLFVFAGALMARGGIADAIIGLADAFVGGMRGGLGQVAVYNSLLLGGMSGSANADAAIDSKVLVPQMVKRGYGLGFASALAAYSSLIAAIIPPAIAMIVYGLLTQVSIGRLFLAGILPGVALALLMSVIVYLVSVRRGYAADRQQAATWRQKLAAIRHAGWAMGMPVLLFVGLRLGVFTPTELGAFAAVYSLAVSVYAYKGLEWREVPSVLKEAALTNGVILLILAAAATLSTAVTAERIPHRLAEGLTSVIDNPVLLILLVNLLLILLGTVFEALALMIMVAPILAPLAAALGMDPVQFGIMIVFNIGIGAVTPPVGAVMFTVCSITGCSIEDYTKSAIPLLGAVIIVLMLIAFWPDLTLLIPRMVFG